MINEVDCILLIYYPVFTWRPWPYRWASCASRKQWRTWWSVARTPSCIDSTKTFCRKPQICSGISSTRKIAIASVLFFAFNSIQLNENTKRQSILKSNQNRESSTEKWKNAPSKIRKRKADPMPETGINNKYKSQIFNQNAPFEIEPFVSATNSSMFNCTLTRAIISSDKTTKQHELENTAYNVQASQPILGPHTQKSIVCAKELAVKNHKSNPSKLEKCLQKNTSKEHRIIAQLTILVWYNKKTWPTSTFLRIWLSQNKLILPLM